MFNVRVYGILINEYHQILVSDEYIRGAYYTKFPGGGMEIGEGTRDCLKREFLEEMNTEIEVQDHFYTTDYYVQSVMNPSDQIVSIYYTVKPVSPLQIPLAKKKYHFTHAQLEYYEKTKAVETFRFIDLANFSAEEVNLPIDKVVAKMIQTQYQQTSFL